MSETTEGEAAEQNKSGSRAAGSGGMKDTNPNTKNKGENPAKTQEEEAGTESP